MGIELSARAELLLQKTNKRPNLILEIDGANNIYSAIETLELPRFDTGLFFDDGHFFDKGVVDTNALQYISLSGSGAKIQNQLEHDKGAASSISTLNVELIDKDGHVANLVSPNGVFTDILNRSCTVYLNFEGGLHPEDSIVIHRGSITRVRNFAASSLIQISHPERKKRQKVFIPSTTKLAAQALVGDTTITVSSTADFLEDAILDGLKTYIRIGDEYIQYTGKTSTTFTGCTRGQLGTTAAQHEIDDAVTSLYRIQDTAVNLALKLMMSGAGQWGETDVLFFGGYSPSELDNSIIFFNHFNIQKKAGFTIGDFAITADANNVGNNGTFEILDYGTTPNGSWIQIDGSLTTEMSTSATCSFSSKYDVWTDGMGMNGLEVDVLRHESIADRFSSSIPDMDFRLEEEITNEFIAKELFLPSNLYAIPRDAKASVGITAPPIADETTVFLDADNVVDPSSLAPERGLNEHFYNSVVYKYEHDIQDDRYLKGYVEFSADSYNRFELTGEKIGNQSFVIESKGLRDDADTNIIVSINARNTLARFEFAPEKIADVKVLSTDGIKVEVGDVVAFGDSMLKVLNVETGNRSGDVKLYEVINKSLDIKTASIVLTLLQTDFDSQGRYALIAPSTKISSGSTTTKIYFKLGYYADSFVDERKKWQEFIGQRIRITNSDYSFDETVTLVSLSDTEEDVMNVTSLSSPPLENYVIDLADYDDSNSSNQERQKILYCHFMPQLDVVSGISATQFTVSAGDAAKISIGQVINIHSNDYSVDSAEVLVTDKSGTTITVESIGFTPSAGQKIELVGFLDGGKPYRIYVG